MLHAISLTILQCTCKLSRDFDSSNCFIENSFHRKIFRAFFRNKKLKSCNSYIISNLFYTCISNDLQKFLYCLNSHTKKKLFNIIHVCYYTSNCTCKTVMVHGQLSSNINSLETFNSMADMFLWNTDLF